MIKRERQVGGGLVISGINAVAEALQADSSRFLKIIVARGKGGARLQAIIDQARRRSVPVHFEPPPAIERQAGNARHQGVMAILSPISYSTLDDLVQADLLILVDGVEDPRNLGALMRTGEAVGAGGILIPDRHSCGVNDTVIRASAGAAFHLGICQIGNVVKTLKYLKEKGFWVAGLDPAGETSPRQMDPELRFVVVVGGEDRGLRRLVREQCDYRVKLPMKGKIASLNMSVAAGVLLYEILLNRLEKTS